MHLFRTNLTPTLRRSSLYFGLVVGAPLLAPGSLFAQEAPKEGQVVLEPAGLHGKKKRGEWIPETIHTSPEAPCLPVAPPPGNVGVAPIQQPGAQQPNAQQPNAPQPNAQQPGAEQPPNTGNDLLAAASAQAGTGASATSAPYMLGDIFGGSRIRIIATTTTSSAMPATTGPGFLNNKPVVATFFNAVPPSLAQGGPSGGAYFVGQNGNFLWNGLGAGQTATLNFAGGGAQDVTASAGQTIRNGPNGTLNQNVAAVPPVGQSAGAPPDPTVQPNLNALAQTPAGRALIQSLEQRANPNARLVNAAFGTQTAQVTSSAGGVNTVTAATLGYTSTFSDTITTPAFLQLTQTRVVLDVANPGGGGAVGRVKLADDSSPMPRDRVYFNYDYFNSVPLGARNIDVHRYAPGVEKTFLDGMASVDVRIPFATTLSSVQTSNNGDAIGTELGNVNVTLKGLVYTSDTVNISTGLGIGAPTASATRAFVPGINGPFVRIENQSIHLQPFTALLLTPNDRLFMQFFVQSDFDTRGNDLSTNFDGTGLRRVGRLFDPNLLYLDASVGYWLRRADPCESWLTGIAPMLELHYTTTMNSANSFNSGGAFIGDTSSSFDVLNITGGLTFEMNGRSTLALFGAAPLLSGSGRQFDYQLGVQLNYRFGPQSRLTRAQTF